MVVHQYTMYQEGPWIYGIRVVDGEFISHWMKWDNLWPYWYTFIHKS